MPATCWAIASLNAWAITSGLLWPFSGSTVAPTDCNASWKLWIVSTRVGDVVMAIAANFLPFIEPVLNAAGKKGLSVASAAAALPCTLLTQVDVVAVACALLAVPAAVARCVLDELAPLLHPAPATDKHHARAHRRPGQGSRSRSRSRCKSSTHIVAAPSQNQYWLRTVMR
jgi:hypothetical protein